MQACNILVQLLTANYCEFCCFSKDIKEKGKRVVYIHPVCAQLPSERFSQCEITIPPRPHWGVTLTE